MAESSQSPLHRVLVALDSFDRETLAAAKSQVNRLGMPTATELQSSNDMLFPLLALPDAQARRAKLRNIGYGVRSDFELNFGRYLPSFGRAGGDDTDTQPDFTGGSTTARDGRPRRAREA